MPAVLVEGEFDALAVAQEAGDLVAAVATGSTCGARRDRWVKILDCRDGILVAFDDDGAGEKAVQWWLNALSGARRLVPQGDPAGMLKCGKELRVWINGGLSS